MELSLLVSVEPQNNFFKVNHNIEMWKCWANSPIRDIYIFEIKKAARQLSQLKIARFSCSANV